MEVDERIMTAAIWRRKAEKLLSVTDGAGLFEVVADENGRRLEEIDVSNIEPGRVYVVVQEDDEGAQVPIVQVRTSTRPEPGGTGRGGVAAFTDSGAAMNPGLLVAHLPRATQQTIEAYERLAHMYERAATAAQNDIEKLRKEKRDLEDKLATFERGGDDGENAEIAAVLGELLMKFLNRQDRRSVLVTINERVLSRLPEHATREEVASVMAEALKETTTP